jgi:hypothetical protein
MPPQATHAVNTTTSQRAIDAINVSEVFLEKVQSPLVLSHMVENVFSCSACRPSEMAESNNALITNDDLMAFMKRLEFMDRDDPAWEFMMDRFVPGLSYQSWRRDPEVKLYIL